MQYHTFMRHLTIRNVPTEVARRLDEERHARRKSLNQTVLDLLAEVLGVGSQRRRSNGLAGLAGPWSRREQKEFEQAIAQTEQIDEELWR
jgi:hypothetical protein